MNIVLLTAGGTGTRMHQDIPKQFIKGDKTKCDKLSYSA